jgi:hypothetical protein
MSSLFKPKMPKVQPTPPPPTIDEAQQRRIEERRLSRRRGRAASIMSTPESRMAGAVGTTTLTSRLG